MREKDSQQRSHIGWKNQPVNESRLFKGQQDVEERVLKKKRTDVYTILRFLLFEFSYSNNLFLLGYLLYVENFELVHYGIYKTATNYYESRQLVLK